MKKINKKIETKIYGDGRKYVLILQVYFRNKNIKKFNHVT